MALNLGEMFFTLGLRDKATDAVKRAVAEFRSSHGQFESMSGAIKDLYVVGLKEMSHAASFAATQAVDAFRAMAGSALSSAGPVGRAAAQILASLEKIQTGFKLLSSGASLHSWADYLSSLSSMMPGVAGAFGSGVSFMMRAGDRLGNSSRSNIGKIIVALILLGIVVAIIAKKFDLSFGDIVRAIRRAQPAALVFRGAMLAMRTAASAATDTIVRSLGDMGQRLTQLATDTKQKATDFTNSVKEMVSNGQRIHSLAGTFKDLGQVIASSTKIGLSAVGTMVGVMAGIGSTATSVGAGVTTMAVTSTAALSGMALKVGAVLGGLGAVGTAVGGMIAAGAAMAVAGIAKIGISALAEIPVVKKAFEDLKSSAKKELTEAASVMQPQLLQAVGQLKTVMSSQIAPELTKMFAVIGPLLTQFTTGVGAMLAPLMPAVTGLVQAVAPMLSNLAGSLGQFGGQLAGFLQPLSEALASNSGLLSAFVTGVGGVLQALGPLLAALVQVAGAVTGPLMGALQLIAMALSQTVGAALVTLAPQLGQIITALGQLIAAVLPILPPILQLGATLAGTLLPVLVQLAQTFMAALQPVMVQLQPLFAGLVGAFANLMTAALPLVGPIVQIAGTLATAFLPVVTSLVPVMSQIALVFGGALVQGVQLLVTAFAPLMPVIGQIVQVLGGVLANVLTALAPLFVQVAQLVASLVPPFTPLLQLVGQFAGQVGGVLVQGFTTLVTALSPLLPVLTQLGQILGAALTQAMQALMPAMLGIVQAFMAILPAAGPLVTIVADLLMAFMPLIQQILPIAAQLITALAPIVTTLAQAIVGILPGVTGLLGLLGKLVGLVLPPVISLFTKLATYLIGPLVSSLSTVVSGVATAVKGILKPFEWLYDVLIGHSIIPDLINGIVKWFKGLPTKVIAALKNMGTWLVGHGKNLIDGFKQGISNAWARVQGWFKGLIGQLPQWVKDLLGIKSPSTVMAALGSDTVKGFIVGLTGEKEKIKSTAQQLSEAVVAAFKSGKISAGFRDSLVEAIGKGNQELQKLADERKRIAEVIKSAMEFASSTADSIRQSSGLGSMDFGDAGPSGSAIRQKLAARLAQVRRFADVIKKLSKRGLSKSIMQQVIEAGVDGGTVLGEALLSASSADFKAINSLATQIDKAAKQAGKNAADAMFDSGKNAGKGFLAGLISQKKQIEAAMKDIANSLVSQIKKQLKIKSPSQVFAEIGGFTMSGLGAGLAAAAPKMLATATGIAGQLGQAFARPIVAPPMSGAAGLGGSGNRMNFEINNYYPQAEPTSKSMNRGLQYAAAVGLAS